MVRRVIKILPQKAHRLAMRRVEFQTESLLQMSELRSLPRPSENVLISGWIFGYR